VLDPVIDLRLLPWSFAYPRGLGVKDAVAALTDARDSGCTWVARADIRDCFDRIPQWKVMRRLRESVDDERVMSRSRGSKSRMLSTALVTNADDDRRGV